MPPDQPTAVSGPRLDQVLAKLAALHQTLPPDEQALLTRWLTATLAPEHLWPATERVDPAAVPAVTVYPVPGCAACAAVAAFLTARGVAVRVVDVRADRAGARELIRVRRGVPGAVGVFPLLVVGDQVVVGFDAARLRMLLRPAFVGR